MVMKRAVADSTLEECLAHLRDVFPADVAFGLVLVVPTDEEPGGELAYGGTMTLAETGEVVFAYLEASDPDDGAEEEYRPSATKKARTLN